jgi:hypothetical protein
LTPKAGLFKLSQLSGVFLLKTYSLEISIRYVLEAQTLNPQRGMDLLWTQASVHRFIISLAQPGDPAEVQVYYETHHLSSNLNLAGSKGSLPEKQQDG